MNPPEIEALVNAGFKLCAEIEDAIIAENVGLALENTARLQMKSQELTAADPRGRFAYSIATECLAADLLDANVVRINACLRGLRMLLAEEISPALVQTYLNASPRIGAA